MEGQSTNGHFKDVWDDFSKALHDHNVPIGVLGPNKKKSYGRMPVTRVALHYQELRTDHLGYNKAITTSVVTEYTVL